jgi:hypothetical protein
LVRWQLSEAKARAEAARRLAAGIAATRLKVLKTPLQEPHYGQVCRRIFTAPVALPTPLFLTLAGSMGRSLQDRLDEAARDTRPDLHTLPVRICALWTIGAFNCRVLGHRGPLWFYVQHGKQSGLDGKGFYWANGDAKFRSGVGASMPVQQEEASPLPLPVEQEDAFEFLPPQQVCGVCKSQDRRICIGGHLIPLFFLVWY